MSKKLHSLLEMAIVIGGLIAAPIVVFAPLEPVTVVQSDRAAATMVQDYSSPGVPTVELRY